MDKSKILKQFSISDEDLQAAYDQQIADFGGGEDLDAVFHEAATEFEAESILTGKIVSVGKDGCMVDVGYKSEGIVPLSHFDDPSTIKEGDSIDVLIEAIEDEEGLILLSKRKADRIRGWEKVIATYNEGDIVKGRVSRKIKGGLLIEIGVPVFLPASSYSTSNPKITS